MHGLGIGPDFIHLTTAGRKEVEGSGQHTVPVLVTDAGEVITDSKRIVDWAEANPATGSGRAPQKGSCQSAPVREQVFAF